jgi:hypothetical protein
MDKADCRGVARRHDDGVTNSIETAIGAGQGAVDAVGGLPTRAVVAAPLPLDPGGFAGGGIGGADAEPLAATQLLNGMGMIHFFLEPSPVEMANDGEPGIGIGSGAGLTKQVPGRTSLTESDAVYPDGLLPAPLDQASGFGQSLHGGMGDGSARPGHGKRRNGFQLVRRNDCGRRQLNM